MVATLIRVAAGGLPCILWKCTGQRGGVVCSPRLHRVDVGCRQHIGFAVVLKSDGGHCVLQGLQCRYMLSL